VQFKEKIYQNKDLLSKQVAIWKDTGHDIVFTNGVFDLIHLGHISYLSEASQLGSKFIIGINSDKSTSSIKGPSRPLNDEQSRTAVIAAFGFVDAVFLFDELTPKNIIEKLSPDVLVKGGDYNVNDIVGAEHVLSLGGEVKVLPFIDGYSSTNIINKIKKNG